MTPNFNLPPGTLASDIDDPEPCSDCNGKGSYIIGESEDGQELYTSDCPTCGGLGIANQNTRS